MTTEAHREGNRRWYQKTKELRIARAKAWNQAHPELCHKYRQKWLANGGREWMAAYMRDYRAERKILG